MPYVGTVVNGIVNSGRVKTGDPVLFGPDSNGNYQTTVVKSMQRKRFVFCSYWESSRKRSKFEWLEANTLYVTQGGRYNG